MHGSLVWMLHNDVNELEETFAIAEAGPLGKVVERELCKEGKQLAVAHPRGGLLFECARR